MTDKQSRVMQCADFFKAVGEPNRVRIIGLLLGRPRTVEEIAATLDMCHTLATSHLARLASVGLVSIESEGCNVRYRIHAGLFLTMTKRLLGLVADVEPRRPLLRLVKPTQSPVT